MKNIILIIAFITGSFVSFAQIQSASLTASGLTCSMCSKAIYKALVKVPSIQNVSVDIENSRYDIIFKPGANVVLDDLKKAVVNAGFSVASLKITASFGDIAIENDAHIAYNGATYHFLNVPKRHLSGKQVFTVVDKNFVSPAEHLKYRQYTGKKCFETGKAEACCTNSAGKGSRVYHVTL